MKTLPTDDEAIKNGCVIDDSQAKEIRLFAKKYCGCELLDWQYSSVVEPIWSWKRPSGQSRWRWAHLWLPKKSGKSYLLSIIATWKLASSKTKTKTIVMSGVKEQTDEIWRAIETFAQNNEILSKRFWFRADKGIIIDRVTKSELKIISGKGDAKSGFNCDLLIIDEFFELHPAYAQKTWDKVQDAGMARPDSLVITISHANFNHNCPAYSCWLRSHDILDGKSDDWTTYALHYGVGEYDDWKDEKNWWPELPGCPDLVSQDWYREKYNKVKDSTVESVQFRTFHLNQLVTSQVSWLSPSTIAACQQPFNESIFNGHPVDIGVDVGKSYDLYSYTLSCKIDDKFYVIQKAFIPEKKADEWEKMHHVPYRAWASDPLCNLELTPGDCIDHLFVLNRIRSEAGKHNIRTIYYDPTNFEASRQQLWREGYNVKAVGTSSRYMGPCFKQLETLFITGKLRHNGNPLFLNHLNNAVPDMDRWDQLMIKKEQDINKIDLVDSTAISLAHYLEFQEATTIPRGQKIFDIL